MSDEHFEDFEDFEDYSPSFFSQNDPMAILGIKEACDYLKMSKSLLYGLVRSNEIPHARIRRRILFTKQNLFNWVNQNTKCENVVLEDDDDEN